MFKKLLFFLFIIYNLPFSESRLHQLVLKNEFRHYFGVSTFGFFKGGTMEVTVYNITFNSPSTTAKTDMKVFGFSLARTASNSVTPYLENHQETCILLEDFAGTDENINIVSFIVHPKQQTEVPSHVNLQVNCSKNFTLSVGPLEVANEVKVETVPAHRKRRSIDEMTSDTFLMSPLHRRNRRKVPETGEGQLQAVEPSKAKDPPPLPTKGAVQAVNGLPASGEEKETVELQKKPASCSSVIIPVEVVPSKDETSISYSFKFEVKVEEEHQEGLYSLYFHNCANYDSNSEARPVNLSMLITEKNENSFLSAGEIPLPRLFFCMSLIFFVTGCCWIFCLRKKKEDAYKIHYLMGLLVFVKSLSLMFHGINYYFIAEYGYHVEAWAVMYYITHLLKGALLFITIVLIGTGWAFIKHILSDKDKKIFMIVIPLQVLANVAEIIMEESEEGETQHNTWREVFIMVDLLCCGAILFPVVWSIRHLQDASQTDGKAAVNLEKLKLFRHFYVMIVCYIYFTRIIVFLLKITVPFQYEWLDEFFREVATLLFFIITGYKFRPTQNNPYFRLPQDDTLEMEEVMTQPGLMENVYKTRRQRDQTQSQEATKRESSHEYD